MEKIDRGRGRVGEREEAPEQGRTGERRERETPATDARSCSSPAVDWGRAQTACTVLVSL